MIVTCPLPIAEVINSFLFSQSVAGRASYCQKEAFPNPTSLGLWSHPPGPKNGLWTYQPKWRPWKMCNGNNDTQQPSSWPYSSQTTEPQGDSQVLKLGFDPFLHEPHVNKKCRGSHSTRLPCSLPEAGNQTHFPIISRFETWGFFFFLLPAGILFMFPPLW